MGLEGTTGGFSPGNDGNGNGKRGNGVQNQEQMKIEEHVVFKYSNDIPLAEEIALGDIGDIVRMYSYRS